MKKVPVSFLVMTVFGGINSCGESSSSDKGNEICVINEDKKVGFNQACTDEFIASDRADSMSCYYESCKVRTDHYDSGCHPSFVKVKVSKPSTTEQCVYTHPTEL